MMLLLSFLLSIVLLGIATTANPVQTISAIGSKFFYEDGTQFFMKGAYIDLITHPLLIYQVLPTNSLRTTL